MDVVEKTVNEKRLIDANELKKKMCFKCNDEYSDEPCDPGDCVFCNAINDAQTIDAVPVVRCRDCKNYIIVDETCYMKRYMCVVNHFSYLENDGDNHFCSYGERKEGAD